MDRFKSCNLECWFFPILLAHHCQFEVEYIILIWFCGKVTDWEGFCAGGGYVISPLQPHSSKVDRCMVKHMMCVDWRDWQAVLKPSRNRNMTLIVLERVAGSCYTSLLWTRFPLSQPNNARITSFVIWCFICMWLVNFVAASIHAFCWCNRVFPWFYFSPAKLFLCPSYPLFFVEHLSDFFHQSSSSFLSVLFCSSLFPLHGLCNVTL